MNPLLAALVAAGILPQADAERIERQLDPDAARAYAERTLITAFRNGLDAQQRRLLGLMNGTEGQPTARQLGLFWDIEDDLLWRAVGEDVRSLALERAIGASIGLGDASMWELVNEQVIEWVEDYYISADAENVGSVPNLNQTAKTIVGKAINEWQRGELQTAGYNEGLPTLIRALTPAFGETRAENIGISEVTRVFAMAELQSARANPFVTQLQWLTSADEAVCPICLPRNGRIVGKESDDGFRVATDNISGFPPAHPRCRCSITSLTSAAAEALREEGLVTV